MRVLTYLSAGSALPHTQQDCIAALRQLGHEAVVFHLLDHPVHDGDRNTSRAVYHTLTVIAHDPELALAIDDVGLAAHEQELLGMPYVAWYFDPPTSVWGKSTRPGFFEYRQSPLMHLFTLEPASAPKLRELGYRWVEYLPMAANPEVFFPLPPNDPALDPYRAEISFLGNSGIEQDASSRRLKITALADLPVTLYGDEGWNEVIAQAQKRLPECRLRYGGYVKSREEQNLIFNASRINLNLIALPDTDYLPIRSYDVPASGGFMLSEYRPELERIYRLGEEVAEFRGLMELRRKVLYFLEHEAERRTIARRGRERILAEHTYVHRVRKILEAVPPRPASDADRQARKEQLVAAVLEACLANGKTECAQALARKSLELPLPWADGLRTRLGALGN